MAIDATDWTITRSTGAIRYIGDDHGGGSPTYATVIEFRRWLGGLSDDAASAGDDEYDITDPAAADRSTDNIITLLGTYNIDAGAAEHLYDGSIIQGTGGSEEFYDGVVNFGNADVQIQLIQDGAVLSDDWWNFSGAGLNADAAQGISHRFMINTRTAGADVDGRRLIGTSRTFGNGYSEFKINGTSRGNNVLALKDSADLNNATVVGTVAGWTGITLTTEGYVGLDVNNDTTDEFYYSEWNTNQPTRSINDFYERMKWIQRDGSAETIWGLNGELFRGITHQIQVDTPTGTFAAFEAVSWTGGTGQMLAINSTTAATLMWIQLLTGVAPTDGLTITGTGTVDVDTTVTDREPTLTFPFIGASTGTSIVGGYGVGIEIADLTATDKVFDLTNTQITPPNNVQFSVLGVVSGEDRILVTTNDAGDIDTDHYTLNGTLVGGTVTAVVVTGSIDSDTPSSGTIRILRDSGAYTRHPYSAWTGSTFTITSHDFSTDNATTANNVYTSYLDLLAGATTESFTYVYNTDRTLFIRVRDGAGTPIKPFETTAVNGSTGGSATVIRTSDE
jgi:hypothetical protein